MRGSGHTGESWVKGEEVKRVGMIRLFYSLHERLESF
jgi:hypothetical protein